jgi:D-glycero-alpha-D-manno-heptose 1-phosphate guanylyltransferase
MSNVVEAIILAGGLGTRLYPLTLDCPKPMVKVNNRPFLEYILDYLYSHNITKVILSVGYKNEQIMNYFGHSYNNMSIVYSYEDKPLGTGGAIKKALMHTESQRVFVLNGDTFFNIDLLTLSKYQNKNTQILIALNKMVDAKRYGIVITDKEKNITHFLDKEHNHTEGCINGGIYLLNRDLFKGHQENIFSFESFLKEYCCKNICKGIMFDNVYFIDIGIHQDYEKAQIDFKELF